MSATQATVTSTQVAVRYRRNVGRLSIDMSTDTRPIYRSRRIGQHSDRHIGRYVDRHIGGAFTDMSTDISVRKLHMIRILFGKGSFKTCNTAETTMSDPRVRKKALI